MSKVKFLLRWILLLGSVIGFCCTSEQVKPPQTYGALIQKKPKVKEMVALLLHEQDESKRRKAADKIIKLLEKGPAILADSEAVRGVSEVEIALIKSANRSSLTMFNADIKFNCDTIATYQPFQVSKDKNTRYTLLFCEYWKSVITRTGETPLSGFFIEAGFDIFLFDRETETLLLHKGVFKNVLFVSEEAYDSCYSLSQEILYEVWGSLASMVRGMGRRE